MDDISLEELWASFTDDVVTISDAGFKHTVTASQDISHFLADKLSMIMDMSKSLLGS